MKRGTKIALALAALAALGFAGFKAFERPIALALLERVVNRNVGVDRNASLPDGLHVYLCGSGSPMADADRAGPCLGVIAGDTRLIVEAGAGSMRVLGRMGFPVGRTDRLLLTYLHSDHIDGLGELMVQSWVANARAAPLPVSGPPGTIEVAERIKTACMGGRIPGCRAGAGQPALPVSIAESAPPCAAGCLLSIIT